MSIERRAWLLHLVLLVGIALCVAALCYGVVLVMSVRVTYNVHTGQEYLNHGTTSSPLVAPLLLLLAGGVGLVLLLPARARLTTPPSTLDPRQEDLELEVRRARFQAQVRQLRLKPDPEVDTQVPPTSLSEQ